MDSGSRYLIAVFTAGFVTFLLFAIMIGLIKINQLPVSSDNQFDDVYFIRTERERTLNTELVKPEAPPQPVAPPQAVSMQVNSVGGVEAKPNPGGGTGPTTFGFRADGVAGGAGGFGSGAGIGMGTGSGFGIESVKGGGEYLPIVQVPPQYPPMALKQGIEGWVLVEFTIGTEGQVKNAKVVRSEPQGIFDSAALSAVQRFRFRPRLLGTQAVEVTGVQNRIRFRLER